MGVQLRETPTLRLFLCDVIFSGGGHVVLKPTDSTPIALRPRQNGVISVQHGRQPQFCRDKKHLTPPTDAPKFHPDFRPRWLPPQLHYHFHVNVLKLIPEKMIYVNRIAT